MKFSKLILASAIALSSSAFAMQVMDEESLSSTTGQDGITITIATPNGIKAGLAIHDTDGIPSSAATGYGTSGAIVLGYNSADSTVNNFKIETTGIQLNIDAGHGSAGAVLNVGVTIPTGTKITTGGIGVAKSDSASSNGSYDASTYKTIMDSTTITLGATTMNMQLGNAPQGAMIVFSTQMTGGALKLDNVYLTDSSTGAGGKIGADHMYIWNAGSAYSSTASVLDIKANVKAKTTGLEVSVAQFGNTSAAANPGANIQLNGFKLGSSQAIGNVDIIGLDLTGTTITIAGH